MTNETGGRTVLLSACDIVKRFGDFVANDRVSINVNPGRIHALLGENGAGKSTLVKIIYGALQPTSGQLFWEGERLVLANPAAARALGIAMIFQHFSLFEALTVTENIALALPGRFDLRSLAERVRRVSLQYGLPLEPDALVADLSVGERQRIEIVRCLLAEPRLLIMDEPTAVLTPQEAEQLFGTLERLVEEGLGILYISHRLEEVKRLCHDATVLRRGKVVGKVDPARESAATLARLMVGSDVHAVSAGAHEAGEVRLALRGLDAPALTPFSVGLNQLHLRACAGEILAIAGVAGNGQAELFEVLSGERTGENAETVEIAGVACGRTGVAGRRQLGAAFIPEERLGHGAVPDFKLSENVLLTRYRSDRGLVRGGLVNRAATRSMSKRIARAFDVRADGENPVASALSGGNLQKFVVGRELDRTPRIVVVNQPTWGVDAGAAALIRQALVDLARGGAAVLMISQDLDEVFEIADRIAVISRGRLSSVRPLSEVSLETVGLLMAGEGEHPGPPVEASP